MRKALATLLTCGMLLCIGVVPTYAGSLDDVVNSQTQTSQEQTVDKSNTQSKNSNSNYTSAEEFIEQTQKATEISGADSASTAKVNSGLSRIASFLIQILSYFLTAFLAVRVVLDLVYIAIPFSRSILSNGYEGNAGAGGMQQPGMGGMGMGGMGMGGMGMRGGYGMGGMGMNRMGMGGMGMGGMGSMNGMQGQGGASPAMGRVQFVSTAALNAVASESMPGPDGRPQSALKIYAKDMTVVLVITPVLLTLAATGVLTKLGFLIGDMLARAIANIGQMI